MTITHATGNFRTFLIAIHVTDAPDSADVEREFTDRYQEAIATSGHEYAEALARSEALHILINADLGFDGAAYLKSHLC